MNGEDERLAADLRTEKGGPVPFRRLPGIPARRFSAGKGGDAG
jgi:hypothetical protein